MKWNLFVKKTIMRKFFIVFIFLIISNLSYSQLVTVTDSENGSRLEMVTLSSENPKMFITTNSFGEADVAALKGATVIEIRSVGYETQILSFEALQSVNFQLKLVPTLINMQEVVISVNRWNQMAADVPEKVVSISGRDVVLQAPQTAADLLEISGKVFIQKSQQGGGSPMIRGFATNRLLYSVDGIRMNTAIFRSGNIQNVISLDPFAMEKTEVVFGPGSVIYGSDAIGGVMSFQTLTPRLSVTNEPFTAVNTLVRFSSANKEQTGHFDINVGWKKFAFVTSFSANNFGDLQMGSHGPEEYLRPFYVERIDSVDVVVNNTNPKLQTPTAYSQMNMMQKLRWKPSSTWNVEYGFHYSETSNYSRYDRHIRYKNGLPRYGEWYYGPQKWCMNNLTINNSSKNLFYDQVTLRLAQQYFEESRISRNINSAEREIRVEEVMAYSVNLDFLKQLGIKTKLYYGFEGVYNDVVSKGTNEDIVLGTSEKGSSRYPKSDWSSVAAYASTQIKMSEKFVIQSGMRYNTYNLNAVFDTTFFPFPFTEAHASSGALTGSVGFVFRPAYQFVVSANFATAFRSPNVDDLGKVFDAVDGKVLVPNPDLNAEYAYNTDFGVAKVFYDVLKVDVTAYYTTLQNAMVRRDFQLNGLDSIVYDGEMCKVQAIQNAAIANVYGIQGGMEMKLPVGLTFATDINFQKGEEELDDASKSPSRHAAPIFGNTKITYSTQKINIQIYTAYSGEKTFNDMPEEEKEKPEIYAVDANGNPWSPAWYTVNLSVSCNFTEHISATAAVENITDQRYRPYSSGMVAAGRNFVISFKMSL